MHWFGSGWESSYDWCFALQIDRFTTRYITVRITRFASGLELSALVGRWTWAALISRPALSVFNAVYRFIECARHRPFSLWQSVIHELGVMSGLAPLLYTSLSAPVASRIID